MSSRDSLPLLRQAAPAVLPSLLMCDWGNLEREVARLEEADVAALHLDVMDGNFVPNLTYGMPLVETFNRLTDLPLDVHLMIANPERYLAEYRKAGADILTIHVEAVDDPRPLLEQIRKLGAGAGLALNPATPLERVEGSLEFCDLVLVMSVPAGFGGQSFQSVALEKVRRLRELAPDVLLEIDGGINLSNVADCAAAGAHLLVVGSAIFRHDDYAAQVRRLTESAAAAVPSGD
jgi:ribulose-phosphate 3-epimerase